MEPTLVPWSHPSSNLVDGREVDERVVPATVTAEAHASAWGRNSFESSQFVYFTTSHRDEIPTYRFNMTVI